MPPTITTSRPICQSNPEAFDCIGLTDDGATLNDRREAVNATLDAIEACSLCPLLAHCRATTQKEIDSGQSPVGVVRAGIYWGSDATPDPSLDGALTEQSTHALREECTPPSENEQMLKGHDGKFYPRSITFHRWRSITDHTGKYSGADLAPIDLDDRLVLGWDSSWVSLHPRINHRAVELLTSSNSFMHERVVTQLFLDEHPEVTADGREIASDHDVCEAIRIALGRGVTIRDLAGRLSMGWSRLADIARALGFFVPRNEEMRRRAQVRMSRMKKQKSGTPGDKTTQTAVEAPAKTSTDTDLGSGTRRGAAPKRYGDDAHSTEVPGQLSLLDLL